MDGKAPPSLDIGGIFQRMDRTQKEMKAQRDVFFWHESMKGEKYSADIKHTFNFLSMAETWTPFDCLFEKKILYRKYIFAKVWETVRCLSPRHAKHDRHFLLLFSPPVSPQQMNARIVGI